MKMNFGRVFLIILLTVNAILNIPTAQEFEDIAIQNETPQEFVARICDGMYLTSDTQTIDDGVANFQN